MVMHLRKQACTSATHCQVGTMSWAAGIRGAAAYLVMPFSVGDCPMVIFLRNLSFTSITRRQVIVSGSMSNRTNLHGGGIASCQPGAGTCQAEASTRQQHRK